MALEFGDYPVQLVHAGGTYTVAEADVETAAVFGVPGEFDQAQFDVMAARALAHGYKLVVSEADYTTAAAPAYAYAPAPAPAAAVPTPAATPVVPAASTTSTTSTTKKG